MQHSAEDERVVLQRLATKETAFLCVNLSGMFEHWKGLVKALSPAVDVKAKEKQQQQPPLQHWQAAADSLLRDLDSYN